MVTGVILFFLDQTPETFCSNEVWGALMVRIGTLRPADTDMSCLRCAHASLVRHFTPDFPSSINKHLFIFLDYICGHSVDGALPCRLGAFRLTQVWYVLNSLPARKRHETGVAISPLLLDVSSETVIRISYNVRLVETTCWSLPGREIERARKRQFSAD